MWVSPNHPNPPRPPEPPADDGQPLAAIPRGDGRDELRVSLKEFQDRPYVSIRLWSRDDRGQFWPQKGKGVSVRLAEVGQVIDALQAAVQAAGELDRRRQRQGGGADRPEFVDKGRPQRPPWDPDKLRAARGQTGADGFSEF